MSKVKRKGLKLTCRINFITIELHQTTFGDIVIPFSTFKLPVSLHQLKKHFLFKVVREHH